MEGPFANPRISPLEPSLAQILPIGLITSALGLGFENRKNLPFEFFQFYPKFSMIMIMEFGLETGSNLEKT